MGIPRQGISPDSHCSTNRSESLSLPRVMVAAPHGKSGKTILVAGILRALKKSGVDVQPFKKGPDYIDPGWHSLAAGRTSRNLDCLFMDYQAMNAILLEASYGAQLELIEGAMGLFDGFDIYGTSSSAEVAKQTKTPVILLIDVTRMTRTAAALVKGCIDFDPDLHLVGVILNRVRGKRHEARIREAIEYYCNIPVVGAIPEDERLLLNDRHLGLVTMVESEFADSFIDGVADVIREHVDLDLLMRLASKAAPLTCPTKDYLYPCAAGAKSAHAASGVSVADADFITHDASDLIGNDLSCREHGGSVVIAVMRDVAFEFYYEENLRALEYAGARLVFVDSLHDRALPEGVSGLYIGGGFPELYADKLQANTSMRDSVLAAVEAGMPCFAECGGLMYLAKKLIVKESSFSMVGALDLDIRMETQRQAHGYSNIVVTDNHPWLVPGTEMLCHEHHHSRVVRIGRDVQFAYVNTRGQGISQKRDGARYNNTVAGYAHVNAIASPQWALGFVAAANSFRDRT